MKVQDIQNKKMINDFKDALIGDKSNQLGLMINNYIKYKIDED